ncbi:MAG: T9SS type A sorting domain-containing protein [Bacteroidota bacterium]
MRTISSIVLLFLSINTLHAQYFWQDTPSLDSFPVYDFQPTTDGLLMAMSGGGIQKTTDEGASWYSVQEGLEGNTFFSDFAQIGNTIYVASRKRLLAQSGGVYKSSDQGESWQASYDDNLHKDVYSLVSVGNRLVAGTKGGIFISDDAGWSWTKINFDKGESNYYTPYCMVNHGNTIIAGANSHVFLSQDAGSTWQSIRIVDKWVDVNRAAYVSGHFYVASSGAGIYRSANGLEWEKLDLGLAENQENINAFLVLGQDHYYSSAGKIYKNAQPINEGFSMEFPSMRSFTFYKGTLYGGTYRDGVWKYTLAANKITNLPELSVQPNPSASKEVHLTYEVLAAGKVSIILYDQNGKQIRVLADAQQDVGEHQIRIDVSRLLNGSYYIYYRNEQYQKTQSLIISN